MSSAGTCYHCGLPNDPARPYREIVLGETRDFCCPGCQAVASAIVENGLEDYYQFRTEPAKPGDIANDNIPDSLGIYDDPTLQDDFVFDTSNGKQIQLTLEGITCAACGWLIEKQLARVSGIQQVAVNVSERRAMVSWDDSAITLSGILTKLKRIGYQALPFQPDVHEASFKKEQKAFLKKLGLAGIMTMQVMMLMAGLYFDLFGNIEQDTRQYFYWVALVLTTPVVLYSGSVFYLGAIKALSARTVNMDVPVTIAIFGTYLAGLKSTLLQRGDVYFESICMFIFLLLLSRFLEHRSRQRASQISANMTQYIPVTAHRLDSRDNPQTVLAKHLTPGDRVIVKAGDVIPVDGVILDGVSHVDESMLTGEFEPVKKASGQSVYGGTVNQNGLLTVEVKTSLKHALVNQILRLQASAMASKPRAAQLADKFSRHFVLAVLLISAATFLFWYSRGNEDAFWIMISVLVATCPCALGLATPSALTCAMAKLNRRGILLKRADALEQLHDIDTIALDKTGTLTEGQFTLNATWINAESTLSQVMSIAATLESRSEHPIAKAFSGFPLQAVSHLKVVPGYGLEGRIGGRTYRLGSAAFAGVAPADCDIAPNIILSGENGVIAAFSVSDSIKTDVRSVLEKLGRERCVIVSGDSHANVASVASVLGISETRAEQTPELKQTYVQSLQSAGKHVLMLGDGINDTPVLAAADVSVAVGNATDVAKSAADVIFLNDDLSALNVLFDVARRVRMKILQNMGWALGYNILILPFAAGGMLSPWMAVVGMSLSSIIVVTNSTRLLK